MVEVVVDLFPAGCLHRLEMTGHVGSDYGARGSNVACAAITGLVRSCAEAIVANERLEPQGDAESEGVFRITVAHVPDDQLTWLQGVTDVLITGLQRVQRETPGEITLRTGSTG